MSLRIILDGCDGSGKTSKIKEILEQIGDAKTRVFHNGPYKSPLIAEIAYYLQIDYAKSHPDTHVIWDRCHISETIYSRVLREDRICKSNFERIDKAMAELQPLLVLCDPGYDTCMKNWSDNIENEEVQELENYRRVYNLYKELDSFTKIPYETYDYTRYKQ